MTTKKVFMKYLIVGDFLAVDHDDHDEEKNHGEDISHNLQSMSKTFLSLKDFLWP
jgi:hypothetical protein